MRIGSSREYCFAKIQAIVQGQRVCRRNAPQTASCSDVSTVECGAFGPMGESWTKLRFFHLATVLGLRSYRSASRLSAKSDFNRLLVQNENAGPDLAGPAWNTLWLLSLDQLAAEKHQTTQCDQNAQRN
jgi:hypothetical protein